jgi:hypothetical protein
VRASLNGACCYARQNASVGNIRWMLRLSGKSRKQKKLTPSRPSFEDHSAKVLAKVDFPVPASPFNHADMSARVRSY